MLANTSISQTLILLPQLMELRENPFRKITFVFQPFRFEPKINSSTSYIAGSYVKWIEAAGGQTVPILNTYSKSHILKIMSRINGVILPGTDLGVFYLTITISVLK